MQWQDITLLVKKFLVGVALVVAPLLIFLGGLKATERLLTRPVAQLSPNK
jgi:hypothetical protein